MYRIPTYGIIASAKNCIVYEMLITPDFGTVWKSRVGSVTASHEDQFVLAQVLHSAEDTSDVALAWI